MYLSDEEERKIWEQIVADENKHQAENQKQLDYVLQNIAFEPERLELEDLSYWQHEGFVEIEKTDYKEQGYRSYDFYVEKSNPMSGHYMRQDEDGEYHNLVRQWSVGDSGDSFEGVLLYPLKDGRYWKITFSC